jgi:tetratricopeptide (TPR) repeat protein
LTFLGGLTFATRSHGQTPLIRKAYKELAHRRYAAALPLFKSVINADPQNINALNSLVLIYTKKNQFDSALYYKELAEKNKNPKSTALA